MTTHHNNRCQLVLIVVVFQVQDFSMPLFMTVNNEGQAVSLSDHEALLGVYTVQERQFYNESLPRRALESHW